MNLQRFRDSINLVGKSKKNQEVNFCFYYVKKATSFPEPYFAP